MQGITFSPSFSHTEIGMATPPHGPRSALVRLACLLLVGTASPSLGALWHPDGDGLAADGAGAEWRPAPSPRAHLLARHPLLSAPTSCPRVLPIFLAVPVRSMAHDPSAFLQGLAFHDHVLFEASGLYGKSSLRIIDAHNGSVLRQNHLRGAEPRGSLPGALLSRPARRFFAEGVTHWRGKLLMLTWREGSLLEYDASTLAFVREHRNFADQFERREGWGITNDGSWLYVSDGSSRLYVVSPDTLRVVETIRVVGESPPSAMRWPYRRRSGGGGVRAITLLNELEMLPNGVLLFNVWLSDYIGVWDARKRCLLGWINGTGFDDAFRSRRRMGACLNGIAFDETTGELLISGKLWPVMHAIRLEI